MIRIARHGAAAVARAVLSIQGDMSRGSAAATLSVHRSGRTPAGIDMALSARARTILEQMEPNRSYEPRELRAFVPDLTLEHLQDVMRELWVQRQVERVGYSGWRRERSTSPAAGSPHGREDRQPAAAGAARSKHVKPEDMFDHTGFEGLFK